MSIVLLERMARRMAKSSVAGKNYKFSMCFCEAF